MTAEARAARIVVAVAVVAIVAIDALYLGIIRSQGGPGTPDVLTVPFVFGYLVLIGLMLAVSIIVSPAVRPALRASATAGLLVLGYLSGFSIGVGVLIVAGLAFASTVLALVATPGRRSLVSAGVGAAVAVVVLIGGFELSWNYLVCPPNVQMSGTTAGFFGTTRYECLDGHLTTR